MYLYVVGYKPGARVSCMGSGGAAVWRTQNSSFLSTPLTLVASEPRLLGPNDSHIFVASLENFLGCKFLCHFAKPLHSYSIF